MARAKVLPFSIDCGMRGGAAIAAGALDAGLLCLRLRHVEHANEVSSPVVVRTQISAVHPAQTSCWHSPHARNPDNKASTLQTLQRFCGPLGLLTLRDLDSSRGLEAADDRPR